MASDPKPGRDLFISYARVDDVWVFGVKWVSALVKDLCNLLAQKMGRHEAFSIWWDETDLRGNHAVTPEIRTALQQSATLLLVLSPGYLASKWCMQEKELFFEVLGGKPQSRVFVVEKQVLDENQSRPAELADLMGYRFWYRDERNQARTRLLTADWSRIWLRISADNSRPGQPRLRRLPSLRPLSFWRKSPTTWSPGGSRCAVIWNRPSCGCCQRGAIWKARRSGTHSNRLSARARCLSSCWVSISADVHQISPRAISACNWNTPRLSNSPFCNGTIQH